MEELDEVTVEANYYFNNSGNTFWSNDQEILRNGRFKDKMYKTSARNSVTEESIEKYIKHCENLKIALKILSNDSVIYLISFFKVKAKILKNFNVEFLFIAT